MKNLNVEIDSELVKKAKVKATILNIDLKDYVAKLIEIDTKDISLKRGIKK